LPTAYLDDIAQEKDGHEAVMAFLDIFNHRFTTQYYRIWRKYNYPASFEPGAMDVISAPGAYRFGDSRKRKPYRHARFPLSGVVERDAPTDSYSRRGDSVSGAACAKDAGNGNTSRSTASCTEKAGLFIPILAH
jgi:hypothetical protein